MAVVTDHTHAMRIGRWRTENCDENVRTTDWIPSYKEWPDVFILTRSLHVKGVEKGGWNLTRWHEQLQSSRETKPPLVSVVRPT